MSVHRGVSTTGLSRDEGMALLMSLVVPRPVVLISTISAVAPQRHNLAPFSSVSPVCDKPALVSFSCRRRSDGTRKDTATNIFHTREFVLNFIVATMLDKAAIAARDVAQDIDEFALSGLTPTPSFAVKPPRVLEACASLECRVHSTIELGDEDCRTELIIGQIVYAHTIHNLGRDPAEHPIFTGAGALGMDRYVVRGEVVLVSDPLAD